MADPVRVTVVDLDHPHQGCRGHIDVSEDDTVTVHTILGRQMVRVELDACAHGLDACFAEQRQLRVDRRSA